MKHIIETWSRVDENAKIHGIAAIPRISRNNRLYIKSELAKVDGMQIPLNWEHTDKKIGYATFHYNTELEQLYYDGLITDESIALLAKNKTLFTSIEAIPTDIISQCFTPNDCMDIPVGMHDWQLALTEMPGIPETSVNIQERFEGYKHNCKFEENNWTGTNTNHLGLITTSPNATTFTVNEDCMSDCLQQKADSGKPIDDQAKAICHSECEDKMEKLESEIKNLKELLTCKTCGKLKHLK